MESADLKAARQGHRAAKAKLLRINYLESRMSSPDKSKLRDLKKIRENEVEWRPLLIKRILARRG